MRHSLKFCSLILLRIRADVICAFIGFFNCTNNGWMITKSLQLRPTLCDPVDCSLLWPWDSPSKNTGVGGHFLLQGIFLTQGSNPHLYVSPALADGFLTTSVTWEAPQIIVNKGYFLFTWGSTKAHQVPWLCLDHSVYSVTVVLCRGRFQLEYQTGGLRIFVWCFGLTNVLSRIQDWREQLARTQVRKLGNVGLRLPSLYCPWYCTKHLTEKPGWWLFSCSVMSDCLWPHDCNTPGSPVFHYLREFAQTHVRWLGGAI